MKIRVYDIGEAFDAYSEVSEIFTNRRFIFHGKLFSKLLRCPPPGVLSQFVRINSTLSGSLLVSHEVPQGAIFSPFCYTWMTFPSPRKNVALNLTSMTRTFTYRFLDSATAVTKLEQDLHRVATWCCETHLLINPAKTKFVLIAWANFKKTTRELVCVLSGKISWACYFS